MSWRKAQSTIKIMKSKMFKQKHSWQTSPLKLLAPQVYYECAMEKLLQETRVRKQSLFYSERLTTHWTVRVCWVRLSALLSTIKISQRSIVSTSTNRHQSKHSCSILWRCIRPIIWNLYGRSMTRSGGASSKITWPILHPFRTVPNSS